jgi:putative copper export protein
MAEALNVIMRWLHIASVAALIGGILYGRLVMASSIAGLAPDAREAMGDQAAVRFRPLVYFSIAALVLSGIYNMLSNPGHSPRYHMLLGVKLLLVLHVFAVSVLIVQPKNPRRDRMMTGALISGLVVIFIAAWLRRIF